MSCYQHGYFWPSLATPPYCPLLPASPQGYIPYQHRAAVCSFELDILPFLVDVKGSTGVHHLWAHPYFSSSVVAIEKGAFWSPSTTVTNFTLLEKIKVIPQNISPEDSTNAEGYKNSDVTEIITQLKEKFAACEKRSQKVQIFNNTSQKLEYSKNSNRI